VCRALKVLCVAPDAGRLLELKRAAVSVHWEQVGGARSVEELADQVERLAPDVVALDASMGMDAVRIVRARWPRARIVSVGGELTGADASAQPADLRDAILGVPPVGGPVRS
jgi:DNA-binding NarL/FixJ family response regulator